MTGINDYINTNHMTGTSHALKWLCQLISRVNSVEICQKSDYNDRFSPWRMLVTIRVTRYALPKRRLVKWCCKRIPIGPHRRHCFKHQLSLKKTLTKQKCLNNQQCQQTVSVTVFDCSIRLHYSVPVLCFSTLCLRESDNSIPSKIRPFKALLN